MHPKLLPATANALTACSNRMHPHVAGRTTVYTQQRSAQITIAQEECVVDAENAAELASCWEAVTPIAPTTGPLHRARRVVTFPFRLFKKAVYNVHAYNL